MKRYTFDREARVEMVIDAETEDEAIEQFVHAINSTAGLNITVGGFSPTSSKEIYSGD